MEVGIFLRIMSINIPVSKKFRIFVEEYDFLWHVCSFTKAHCWVRHLHRWDIFSSILPQMSYHPCK